MLGDPEHSEQRINFSQAFNGLGWILGPVAGSYFLFTGKGQSPDISMPYLLIGIVVMIVALVFSRIRLPEITPEEDELTQAEEAALEAGGDHNHSDLHVLLRNGAFLFGWVGIFVYVAAQTGVNSFFINYAVESAGIDRGDASLILGFGGMGLFCVGRMLGSWIMQYIRAERLLAVLALVAAHCTMLVVVSPGRVGFTALLAVYFYESIMFPTIFALALRGLGRRTKIASSLLIMGIVGGAVAPVLMGLIADHFSMAYGFVVPLVCFFIIAAYGGFVVRRSARAKHRH